MGQELMGDRCLVPKSKHHSAGLPLSLTEFIMHSSHHFEISTNSRTVGQLTGERQRGNHRVME